MLIKVKIRYPELRPRERMVNVEVKDGSTLNEIVDFLYQNKAQIVKDNGCNLSDEELSSAIALGMVSVNYQI